jgi:hypothetical protein
VNLGIVRERIDKSCRLLSLAAMGFMIREMRFWPPSAHGNVGARFRFVSVSLALIPAPADFCGVLRSVRLVALFSVVGWGTNK